MRVTGIALPIQNLLLEALPKAVAFTAAEKPQQIARPTTVPGQPVSVEMLVALSASESQIDRRRRVAARAEQALDLLGQLNSELLAGLPTAERLNEVAALSQNMAEPADPALANLFKEIELRMRVELAKHDIIA